MRGYSRGIAWCVQCAITMSVCRDIDLCLSVRECRMVCKLARRFGMTSATCDVTCSSGRSIVFVPHTRDSVYQFYRTDQLFCSVLESIKACTGMQGIVQTLHVYPDLRTVQYEYLEPVCNPVRRTASVGETFEEDIQSVLTELKDRGLAHGDFRCDNIGYSPSRGRYVVYDLESMRSYDDYGSIARGKTDAMQLAQSLRFWNIVIDRWRLCPQQASQSPYVCA